ncbi:hypothetical protein SAMN05421630_115121 [Prauserella marina]|uniref:Uncharacterized protein n=1 Tax=Prauserella marina TaxID=530584 RepID=A0A1G6Z4I2_9PSEU|nr:hypothetical protein DES30_112158 [Prauserella marina]SDD97560.1 hypothetical protein SAMN05421630_115121 [Prauserella marina]
MDRGVRRIVKRRVEQLRPLIPAPWDMNVFLDQLEQARNRPIDLCELHWAPGDSTGAWRAMPDHDVIAYPTNTSPWHQDVIILHEIGHMLPQHAGHCVLTNQRAQQLAPDLKPAAFMHLLTSTTGAAEEQEAEAFARSMITQIEHHRHRRTPRGGLRGRVEAAFG